MAGSRIPPQAYTKDTLSSAYAWLKNQPESIKSKAQCADSLVSLYLHARRHGDNAIYAPQNGQSKNEAAPQSPAPSTTNFKSDLKNLAEGLKKFEEPDEPKPASSGRHIYNPAQQRPQQTPLKEQAPPSQVLPARNVPSLDDRSLKMLKIVQDRFNFSTESEALRMIITLGFEQVEKTFPPKPPTT